MASPTTAQTAFIEGLTLKQVGLLEQSAIMHEQQKLTLPRLLSAIAQDRPLALKELTREFFQSLTIAQCLFIRNEVLGTSQQREAWQSAVCEAAGMEPTRGTFTVSNATTVAVAHPPTIRLDSATPQIKSLRVDMIYMKNKKLAIGNGRVDMSPEVSFEAFRTLVAGQFGHRPWDSYIKSMRIDPPVWGDNNWEDEISEENWPEVRDCWLRCDRVLCLVR